MVVRNPSLDPHAPKPMAPLDPYAEVVVDAEVVAPEVVEPDAPVDGASLPEIDDPVSIQRRLEKGARAISKLDDPDASAAHPSLASMLPALAAGHAKPKHRGVPPRSVAKDSRSYFHYGRALALEKIPMEDVYAFVVTGRMTPRMEAVQREAQQTGSPTAVNASRAFLNVGIAAARARKQALKGTADAGRIAQLDAAITKMTKLRTSIARGARARREDVARGYGARAERTKQRADAKKAALDDAVRKAGGETAKVDGYADKKAAIDKLYGRAKTLARRGTDKMAELGRSDAARAKATTNSKRKRRLEKRAAYTFDGAAGMGLLEGEIELDSSKKANGGTTNEVMPKGLTDASRYIADAERIYPPIKDDDAHKALRTGVRKARKRHFEATTIELGYFGASAPTAEATAARKKYFEEDGLLLNEIDDRIAALERKGAQATAKEKETLADLRTERSRLKTARAEVGASAKQGSRGAVATANAYYDVKLEREGASLTGVELELTALDAKAKAGKLTEAESARRAMLKRWASRLKDAPDHRVAGLDEQITDAKKALDDTKPSDGAKYLLAKRSLAMLERRKQQLDSKEVTTPEAHASKIADATARYEAAKKSGDRKAFEKGGYELVAAYKGTPSLATSKAALDATLREAGLRNADADLARAAYTKTRGDREDGSKSVDVKTNVAAADGDRTKVRKYYDGLRAKPPTKKSERRRILDKEARFRFEDARYLARSGELLAIGGSPAVSPASPRGRARQARFKEAQTALDRGEAIRKNELDGGDVTLASASVMAFGDVAAAFAIDRPRDVAGLLGVRPHYLPPAAVLRPGALQVVDEIRAKYGNEAADALSGYLGGKAAVARSRLASRPGAGIDFTNGRPDTQSLIDTFEAEKVIAKQIVDPKIRGARELEIRDFRTQLDLVGALFQTVERDLVEGGALFGANLDDLKKSLRQANDAAIEGLAELLPWESSMNADDDELIAFANSVGTKDQQNLLRGMLFLHAGYNRLRSDAQRIEYVGLLRHMALGPAGLAKAYGLSQTHAKSTYDLAVHRFGQHLAPLDPTGQALEALVYRHRFENPKTKKIVSYDLLDGAHGGLTAYLRQPGFDPRPFVGGQDAPTPVMSPKMAATVDVLGDHARDWAGTARWGGIAGNVLTTAFYVLIPLPLGKTRAVGGAVKAWRGFNAIKSIPGVVQVARTVGAVGGAIASSRAVAGVGRGLLAFRKSSPVLYALTTGAAKMTAYTGAIYGVQTAAEKTFGKNAYATRVVRVLSEWVQPGAAIKVAKLRNLAPQLLLAEGQLLAGQVLIPAVIKDPTIAKWTNFGLSILLPAGIGAGSVAARSRFQAKALTAAAFPNAPKNSTAARGYRKALEKELAGWMAGGGGKPRSVEDFNAFKARVEKIGGRYGVDKKLTEGFLRAQTAEWAGEMAQPSTDDGPAFVDKTAKALIDAGVSPAEAYSYAGMVAMQRLGAMKNGEAAATAAVEHALANQWVHGLDAARAQAKMRPLEPDVRRRVVDVVRRYVREGDPKKLSAFGQDLRKAGLSLEEAAGIRVIEAHRLAKTAADRRIAKLGSNADTLAARMKIAREEAARVLDTTKMDDPKVVELADAVLAGDAPAPKTFGGRGPADPEAHAVSVLGHDTFMKVFGDPDTKMLTFDARRALDDAGANIDALLAMAKTRPDDVKRLLAAFSTVDDGLVRQALREKGPEVALRMADIARTSPEGLRYLRSIHGDNKMVDRAKSDPTALAAEAKAAGARIFMRADDGTWLLKGPAPKTPTPTVAEMSALAKRAGVDPAVLTNPTAHPKAIAKLVRQMTKEMSPEARAAFELEMKGRRFIDEGHYDEAFKAGVTNVEHRYGKKNFDGWAKAEKIVLDAARAGKPLTAALLAKAHKAASVDILRAGRQGVIRTATKHTLKQGGFGPLGNQYVTAAEYKVLKDNPHLDVMDLGMVDGKHNVVVNYLDGAKVPAALDAALKRIDDRLAAGEDPVVIAADAQREVVSIHPFFDGNGRTSRLVMDYVLERAGLSPSVVRDPNLDTSLSKKAWRDEVRKGLERPLDVAKRMWARSKTGDSFSTTPPPKTGHDAVDPKAVRNTVGWSGEPTANPKAGASHLAVIHRGMSRLPATRRARIDRMLRLVESPPPKLAARREQLSDRLIELTKGANGKLRHLPERMVPANRLAERKALDAEFAKVTAEMDAIDTQIQKIEDAAVKEMAELRLSLRVRGAVDAENAAKGVRIMDSAKGVASEKDLRAWTEEFFMYAPGNMNASKIKLRFTDDRAYALQNGTLNVGKNPNRRITFHELGHFLEFANPKVQQAAREWVRARSRQANGGKVEERSLRDITGSDFYKHDEVAYEDHFVSEYVGKKYAKETEVISVGMEYFSSPKKMLDLYRRDPEHFFFMLGVLKP